MCGVFVKEKEITKSTFVAYKPKKQKSKQKYQNMYTIYTPFILN